MFAHFVCDFLSFRAREFYEKPETWEPGKIIVKCTSYVYVYSPVRRYDWREHSDAASRAHPLTRQLYNTRTVTGIGSFALVFGSVLIQLTGY